MLLSFVLVKSHAGIIDAKGYGENQPRAIGLECEMIKEMETKEEQKDKGGKLIYEDGYSFDDLTIDMVVFLNGLKRILKLMFKKSVYIKKVENNILTIDLSKYNKKQIQMIEFQAEKYFRYTEYLDDKYDRESGELFFDSNLSQEIGQRERGATC